MTQPIAGKIDHDRPGTHVMPTTHPGPTLAEALADPRGAFGHPADVVAHPLLSRTEKRTILISWARDELMLEQLAHAALPELKPVSRIDAVIAALGWLDPHAAAEYRASVDALRTSRRAGGMHFHLTASSA